MSPTTIAPESFRPLIIRAIVLPLFLLIGFSAVMLWQVSRLMSVQWWVDHTDQVITRADELLLFHTEMESALRGYLITANADFREPFDRASALTGPASISLQKLVADNPPQVASPQVARLKHIDELRNHWIDYVNEEMRLRASNGDWQQAVRAGVGKKMMDEIRDGLGSFVATEQSLRHQRSQAVHDTVVFSLWFTGGMVVLLGTGLTLLSRQQFLLLIETYGRALETARQSTAVLEQRVAERTLELKSTNERLQISNRELQDFASVASHDLQEPLRKVQAFGDRLKSKSAAALGPEGLDYLERMLNAAARMKTLITDLLTFARVTSRAQPFSPVDLQAVAEMVVSDLETRIEQTGASVRISKLPTIDADVTQMRQMLQNLIGNALKFSKPGQPPVVDVQSETVGHGNDTSVKLSVRDNGIGFDEKYTDRIFTVFQRLHGRQEYEGTGIGLAVCRKIVERHRGSINVSSKSGEGATFTITLPVKQLDAMELTAIELKGK